ncbi:hypothetical protein IWW57_000245 [Coemansia sp. S610]|nr:hypothetical protein IWW57_000245 [Coemansia sp. S610]
MTNVTTVKLSNINEVNEYVNNITRGFIAFSRSTKALDKLETVEFSGETFEIGLVDVNQFEESYKDVGIEDDYLVFDYYEGDTILEFGEENKLFAFVKAVKKELKSNKVIYNNKTCKYCNIYLGICAKALEKRNEAQTPL